MSADDLGRIAGSWRCEEAEENAADLCDYLRRVLWRDGSPAELVAALDRFEAATKGTDYRCIEASEIQYFRRWLVRMELRGTVRRGLPDYEMALDRMESIERGSWGPLHRAWLFDSGEVAELKRLGDGFDPAPEFDFVTTIGVSGSCGPPTSFIIVHDGTPEIDVLTLMCLQVHAFEYRCQWMKTCDPLTFGRCHTASGGIEAVITRGKTAMESAGICVRGPLLFEHGHFSRWRSSQSKVTS